MNIMRALWIAVAAYIASFLLGIVLSVALGYDPTNGGNIPMSLWRATLIVSVLVAAIFALRYFKSDTTRASFKNGLLFGVVLVVVGFAVDSIILLVASGSGETIADFGSYYAHSMFWVTMIAVIGMTAFVGKSLEQDI